MDMWFSPGKYDDQEKMDELPLRNVKLSTSAKYESHPRISKFVFFCYIMILKLSEKEIKVLNKEESI